MKTLDRGITALWIVLGLALCFYARELGLTGPSGPDSGFFPMIAGVLLTVSGVGILVSPGQRDAIGAEPLFRDGDSARRVGFVVGAVLLMIALIPWLGFLLTGALVTPFLLRAIETRSWTFCVAVGALGAGAIVLLFSQVLGVPLPRGPFGF